MLSDNDLHNEYNFNNNRNIRLPLYLTLAFIAGALMMFYLLSPQHTIFKPSSNNKFETVLDYLEAVYVDTINKEQLTEEAINAMLQYLDPHSVYVNAHENKLMMESLDGEFEGVGIQYSVMNDTVMVIATISGGPSEKVGVRAGDRIVTVNDSNIAGVGISNNDVVRLLRGPKGTKVNVGIRRQGFAELYSYTITRAEIPTYTVDVDYMIDSKTGYVKINQFGKTTGDEFEAALKRLNAKGMQKLILDLRGNSGGYLETCIRVCDELLKKNELIVYTEGRNVKTDKIYATRYGHFEQGDLVVLIDDFSASASEIVAGCVQDNDRGTIVGRRSFGKGLVQRQVDFDDNSSVRLTIARYHTPSGRCIQKTYVNGAVAYNEELFDRYLNGEMEHQDSIKFDENLKYKTKNGRTVYGGGGIMPDIFVPLDRDSSMNDFYLIVNSGKMNNFAFDYTTENSAKLKKRFPNAESFVKNMTVDESLFKSFMDYYNKVSDKKCEKTLTKDSEKELKIWLKAFIGRNLYQDAAFYPVINSTDKVVEAAMKVKN